MPMPRLPEIHQSKAVATNAFQVKKNRAATAPRCRRVKTMVESQIIGCVKVLSFRSIRALFPGAICGRTTHNGCANLRERTNEERLVRRCGLLKPAYIVL